MVGLIDWVIWRSFDYKYDRSICLEVTEAILTVLLHLEPEILDALLAVSEDFEAVDVVLLGGAVEVDAVAFLIGSAKGDSLTVHFDLLHRVAEGGVLHPLQLLVDLVAAEPAMVVLFHWHNHLLQLKYKISVEEQSHNNCSIECHIL